MILILNLAIKFVSCAVFLRTNVHRDGFSTDSRLFKDDNQLRDGGFAVSCQSLIDNYPQGLVIISISLPNFGHSFCLFLAFFLSIYHSQNSTELSCLMTDFQSITTSCENVSQQNSYLLSQKRSLPQLDVVS